MYKICYHPRVEKFLKKLPKQITKKIFEKIEILKKNPFSFQLDSKKLITTEKSYRLKIGKIRVVYEINTQNKLIYVHYIDFRGNIY
ncbi:MAG: type II toxin-antitoxin system RelE family toxin [Microgenomates group bacterium]